jgi:2,4-dienoyl-CoA reductase-like NADH-dependent reductase (Old Yellow Enzyme family)/thioredoxin reductase
MFTRLFEPIRVGTMELRNRIAVPTHAAGAGRILGSEKEAERFIAYYTRRARGGAALIGGSSTFLRSPLIPGYEPTGVGAVMRGSYRHPLFVERHKRYMDALHQAGACGTVQMIIQGGLPHGASPAQTGFVYQDVPHALTRAEIAETVEEYGWSAARALEAEVDGLEIHANHDDLLQFFLSPLSNHRDDEYGGSLENRMRFLMEVLRAIRDAVGRRMTVGTRLCMDELLEGGYDFADGLEMARTLSASGLIDYLHVDVGNNWGAPSYLQPMQYEASEWTAMAGEVRVAVDVPVIYTGRVTHPAIGERILAEGQADVVGIARAMIADPDLPNKARDGQLAMLRPCVGANDCLHRGLVEGMRFSCAVNPAAGHELSAVERVETPRRVLVIGGGPAGLETAAIAAERGHDVTVWEREPRLGGQLAIAANAPAHASFADYIEHQTRRLDGTTIELGRDATPDEVVAFGADAVVIATGAGPRIPDVPGAELAVEVRDVLLGAAVGERVVLIAGTDHAEPLLGADYLASRGVQVRLVYPGPQLAPLVGKYSIGGYVARLFAAGVEFVPMQRLVSIEPGVAHTADVYAGTPVEHAADSVVLACGGLARTDLFAALEGRVGELHILGDAWAPRRLTIVTRQAWELGRAL